MMVPLQLQRTETSEIAEDVQRGLTQYPKALPPRLFYDAAGSALFEQITGLPEYYLTRTERGIFEKHAGEMLDQTGQGLTLIELGAGTATKTSIIIRALMRRQHGHGREAEDRLRLAARLDAHRAEEDVPDDRAIAFRDEG